MTNHEEISAPVEPAGLTRIAVDAFDAVSLVLNAGAAFALLLWKASR